MRTRDRPMEFSTRQSQPDREIIVPIDLIHIGGEFVEKMFVEEKNRFLIFEIPEKQQQKKTEFVGGLSHRFQADFQV